MSRPAEKMMRPLNLKRPLVASPSLDSGSSGIIKLKITTRQNCDLSDFLYVKGLFYKPCHTKLA